jgi:hypothetical protein
MKIYIIILACLAIIPYRVMWHTPTRHQNPKEIKIMAERMKGYSPISLFKKEPKKIKRNGFLKKKRGSGRAPKD